MLDNKVRFILAVVKDEIIIRNRKRNDLMKELEKKKFTPFYKKRDPKKAKTAKDDGKGYFEGTSKKLNFGNFR